MTEVQVGMKGLFAAEHQRPELLRQRSKSLVSDYSMDPRPSGASTACSLTRCTWRMSLPEVFMECSLYAWECALWGLSFCEVRI